MIDQQKIKEWVEVHLSHIEKMTPEIHASERFLSMIFAWNEACV